MSQKTTHQVRFLVLFGSKETLRCLKNTKKQKVYLLLDTIYQKNIVK